MPSTLVHVALAGLFGAALLGRRFDARALAVLVGVVAFLDLDAFVGLLVRGAHRAAFHTLVIPAAGALLLAADERTAGRLRERYGARGVSLAWTATFAYVAAGIAPDFFFNGVNLFYPLYDQFYVLNGSLELSSQRGLVQTFVDLSPPGDGGSGESGGSDASVAVGSTQEVHYSTGVDPASDAGGEASVDRVFPLVTNGTQAMLVLTSVAVVSARLWLNRRIASV